MIDSNFIEITPKQNRNNLNSRDILKISFLKPKKNRSYLMIMWMGKNIAEKIGIKGNDILKFYIHKDNQKIWFLKKSEDNKEGYKIRDISKNTLRLDMLWEIFIPNEHENKKLVKHEFFDDGIKVFLD